VIRFFRFVPTTSFFLLICPAWIQADDRLSISQKSHPNEPLKLVRLTDTGRFVHRPVWHPDGARIVFARHEEGGNTIRLFVQEARLGAEAKRLTKRKDPEYDAVISPDGSTVLFAALTISGTQGNLDIASMPFDGSNDPKLVAGDINGQLSHQDWPAWLPDGKRYLLNSTHEGNQEIYLGYADGSKPLERLTQSPGQDVHPAVSSSSDFAIFATDRWGGLELARMNLNDRSVTRLTESPGFDDYPSISPDGKRWVFVSNRSGNPDLWLGAEEGKYVRLTDSPEPELFPSFSKDGRKIVFVSGMNGSTDVYTIELP
jgi:TolB protein